MDGLTMREPRWIRLGPPDPEPACCGAEPGPTRQRALRAELLLAVETFVQAGNILRDVIADAPELAQPGYPFEVPFSSVSLMLEAWQQALESQPAPKCGGHPSFCTCTCSDCKEAHKAYEQECEEYRDWEASQ